jgi:hypothetical protein
LCQDDYAEYLICMRSHPKTLENSVVYLLPMSQYFTSCKILHKKWKTCQDYRERQLLEELREIF